LKQNRVKPLTREEVFDGICWCLSSQV
jgi:hypothetical protein